MSKEPFLGSNKYLAYLEPGKRHFLAADKPVEQLLTPGAIIGYGESMKRKKYEETHEVPQDGKPKVVIAGSFRYKAQIDALIDLFTEEEIRVLAPPKGRVVRLISEGFKLLDGDEEVDESVAEMELEGRFLEAVSNADVLYLYNPKGYIGNTVRWEITVATTMCHLPIFALEELRRKDKKKLGMASRIPALGPKEFTQGRVDELI